MAENFTDKERMLICGLEAIGLFYGSQSLFAATYGKTDIHTVEDVIKLYDETGQRQAFKSTGEITNWTRYVLDGPFLADLHKIESKMPEEFRIRTDKIEFEVEEIIRRGF